MKKIKLNKKGNVLFGVMDHFKEIFLFIMVAIIMGAILLNFATEASNITIFQNENVVKGIDLINKYPAMMDVIAGVVYVLAIGFSVIAAKSVEKSMISFVISWIVVTLMSGAMVLIGYIFDTILNESSLANVKAQMYFIPFFAEYMIFFALIYMFIVLLTLHGVSASD